MDSTPIILLFYAVGLLLLVAEIFVPSHGLLTLGALTCFGIALFHTFAYSTMVGIIGTVCCIAVVPAVLFLGLKYVHRLPMADQLAPSTQSAYDTDLAETTAELRTLVGQVGMAKTPLHPIGMCEFNGRRVPCVAESGMIDAGAVVVGADVRMQNLAVRLHAGPDADTREHPGTC